MVEEVVHEHVTESSSSGMGFLFGIIMLVVVLMLFFFYGLPILRNMTSGGITVNVPDKINVNLNQQGGGQPGK